MFYCIWYICILVTRKVTSRLYFKFGALLYIFRLKFGSKTDELEKDVIKIQPPAMEMVILANSHPLQQVPSTLPNPTLTARRHHLTHFTTTPCGHWQLQQLRTP